MEGGPFVASARAQSCCGVVVHLRCVPTQTKLCFLEMITVVNTVVNTAPSFTKIKHQCRLLLAIIKSI